MKTSANQKPKVRKLQRERAELRKYLRNGDITKIAKLADVDRNVISLWFKGAIKTSVAEPYITLFVKTRKEEVESSVAQELRAAS